MHGQWSYKLFALRDRQWQWCLVRSKIHWACRKHWLQIWTGNPFHLV